MNINQNPFISDIFSTKWLAKFNRNKPVFSFNFIGGLRFYKSSNLPIYINAGRSHTKGISYKIIKKEAANIKKSIVLIYDVPDYFDVETSGISEKVKLYRIKQYSGYLADLKAYKDTNDYLQSTFSKKKRIKRYENRLELCFDVKYRMYYGDILKEDYDFIFDVFRKLLEKRFDEKQITNNNLNPSEWEFYYDVAFPLIKEKKASLFVVYQGSSPIAITLNFISENILFNGITVFDIDYSKFHLGNISLNKQFSWSIMNKIKIFDFSKGYFDYKTHWSNKRYNFEYHLYFDKSSISISLLALGIKKFFELKQYLREKEFNNILNRFTYLFGRKKIKSRSKINFTFSEISQEYEDSELSEINILNTEFESLKKIANEFLFLNKETMEDLSIMKVINKESTFLFKGKERSKLLVIH